MSDKLANENKRLSAIIRAVERQRDEALTARAHADATAALLQEVLREMKGSLDAATTEIAAIKAELLELKKPADEAKAPKKKAA